ncbi:MAG: hypothetical protein ACYSTX_06530 [Planctomycetota bacterium]|jgi:hypothetical protein
MVIKVKYSSIDHCHKYGTFKTLKGAQKFAHKWVGEHPDMGGWYAVSFDGIGKIEVSGDATLKDLFPSDEEEYEYEDPDYY